jgi:hypothetical protein
MRLDVHRFGTALFEFEDGYVLSGTLDPATGDLRWDAHAARWVDEYGAAIDQFLEWYFQHLRANTYTVTV